MNQTLQQIHDLLLAQHLALAQKLGSTTDPDLAKTILTEMQEVLHRTDMVQSLLFAEESRELDATLPVIQKANTTLTASIQSISNTAAFLGSVANFLKGVDEAIDLAKTLAIA